MPYRLQSEIKASEEELVKYRFRPLQGDKMGKLIC